MAETETEPKLCRRDGLLRKETGHNGRKRRLLWKNRNGEGFFYSRDYILKAFELFYGGDMKKLF